MQPLVQGNGIRIYNVFGEEVSSDVQHLQDFGHLNVNRAGMEPAPTRKIDVSMLTAGIYFVRVGEKTGKFIKINL